MLQIRLKSLWLPPQIPIFWFFSMFSLHNWGKLCELLMMDIIPKNTSHTTWNSNKFTISMFLSTDSSVQCRHDEQGPEIVLAKVTSVLTATFIWFFCNFISFSFSAASMKFAVSWLTLNYSTSAFFLQGLGNHYFHMPC